MIDYMVMEAVALKISRLRQEEEKAAKRREWQAQEKERLKQMVR